MNRSTTHTTQTPTADDFTLVFSKLNEPDARDVVASVAAVREDMNAVAELARFLVDDDPNVTTFFSK